MLNQNWALAVSLEDGSCRIYFIDDLSGIFDEMDFESMESGLKGLERNGFQPVIDW